MGFIRQSAKGIANFYASCRHVLNRVSFLNSPRTRKQQDQGVPQDFDKARNCFEKKETLGNTDALNTLGDMDKKDQEVPQDYSKAREQCKKTAEQDNATALTNPRDMCQDKVEVSQEYANLGDASISNDNLEVMNKQGQSVPQDFDKARDCFEKEEMLGNTDALNSLEEMNEKSHGVSQDYAKTRELYEKDAEQGNATALINLGSMYQKGQGVPQDFAKARELYEKAAEQGDATALINLGSMYQEGQGVPQDFVKARELYEKAAEQGNATALTNLGLMYQYGVGVSKNYAKAREFLKKASDLGDADALTCLGLMYKKGQGVVQNFAKTREFFEKAAKLGNALALNNLGSMYEEGQGVPQDYAKAREMYEKAAEQGDALSLINLGSMYQEGLGVNQDDAKAREFFEKASKHDDALVLNKVETMYRHGLRASQDYDKTLELIEKASELSDSKELKSLDHKFFDEKLEFSDAKEFKSLASAMYDRASKLINSKEFKSLAGELYDKSFDLNQNQAEANFSLGLKYKFGTDTEINPEKAQKLFFLAASNKHPNAMAMLALCLDQQHNLRESLDWYKQAANLQNPIGCIAVGMANWFGILTGQNREQALSFFNSANQENSALGLFVSGQFALDEFVDGTTVDSKLALNNFSQALNLVKENSTPVIYGAYTDFLEAQNIEAWLNYALLMDKIIHQSVDLDLKNQSEFVSLQNQSTAPEDATKNLATYLIGSLFLSQESYCQHGVELLDSLAQSPVGDSSYLKSASAFKLGCFYESNDQGIQEKALMYFRLAAMPQDLPCFDFRNVYHFKALLKLIKLSNHGEVSAESLCFYEQALDWCLVEPCFKLGQWYQSNNNLDKAMEAYQIASQGGITQAQYTLAQIYHTEDSLLDNNQARKLYEQALEQGIVEAAIYIGEIYEHGQSCTVDLTKAFDLYLKAANAGFAEAQFRVGICYLHGSGTDLNAQKALSWLEQATKQNHSQALYTLGKIYEEGVHVASDFDKACNFYQKAAELDNQLAATALAKLKLASGDIGDTQELLQQLMDTGNQELVINFYLKNLNQSLKNQDSTLINSSLEGLKALAEQENLMAQVSLAQYYEMSNSQDGVTQAQTYHHLAAEQGHVPSFVSIAKVAFSHQDHAEAFKWLTKLAECAKQSVNKLPLGYGDSASCDLIPKAFSADDWKQDIAEAYLLLAKCYEQGLGTSIDCKRAFDFYSKAESAGLIEARFALSLILLTGRYAVKADERQAITLLNKMVKRKFAPAQFELGKLYLNGQGVKADPKQAFTLIKAAADQKLPEAMAKLSELYSKGIGTEANLKKSQAYLNQAQALGWKR